MCWKGMLLIQLRGLFMDLFLLWGRNSERRLVAMVHSQRLWKIVVLHTAQPARLPTRGQDPGCSLSTHMETLGFCILSGRGWGMVGPLSFSLLCDKDGTHTAGWSVGVKAGTWLDALRVGTFKSFLGKSTHGPPKGLALDKSWKVGHFGWRQK